VQELAYAPLYNKSSIYGKGMTTLCEGMLVNTVQLFSLLHLEHMPMRPYQQDTGFAITPDDLIHEGDSPL
jgi:hypothetical protein